MKKFHAHFIEGITMKKTLYQKSTSSVHSEESTILTNIHQNHCLDFIDGIFPHTHLPNADNYYYCLTGLPKSIYRTKFGLTPVEYVNIYDNEIYPTIQQIMEACHVRGTQYMVIDDTKLIGIIFQLCDNCRISPLHFTEKVQNSLQEIYIRTFPDKLAPYSNTTALTSALHGKTDLYYGCSKATLLKQLSFFLMSQNILTEEYISCVKNHADYETVINLCQRICFFASHGSYPACKTQLENLFLHVLKYCFDFELTADCLSYFKNFLHIRFTVYGIAEKQTLSTLCNVNSYITIEECYQAILPAFERLCCIIQETTSYTNTVTLAAYYIHVHITEDVSLTDMAEYADTTPSHLSKIFHQQTRQTVKQYQTQVRIQHAEQLLASTDLKIMEIAEACGFRDRRYFSDIFKKTTGKTPQQYRTENEM